LKGGRRRRTQKEVCARVECKKKFTKNSHNQKFCGKKCCRLATNKKLLDKYYENKVPIKQGRICQEKGCATILSVYNKSKICGSCELKKENKLLRQNNQ
jgi:hypothetical protein